jgi:hypothetical protein
MKALLKILVQLTLFIAFGFALKFLFDYRAFKYYRERTRAVWYENADRKGFRYQIDNVAYDTRVPSWVKINSREGDTIAIWYIPDNPANSYPASDTIFPFYFINRLP